MDSDDNSYADPSVCVWICVRIFNIGTSIEYLLCQRLRTALLPLVLSLDADGSKLIKALIKWKPSRKRTSKQR